MPVLNVFEKFMFKSSLVRGGNREDTKQVLCQFFFEEKTQTVTMTSFFLQRQLSNFVTVFILSSSKLKLHLATYQNAEQQQGCHI